MNVVQREKQMVENAKREQDLHTKIASAQKVAAELRVSREQTVCLLLLLSPLRFPLSLLWLPCISGNDLLFGHDFDSPL